MENLSLDVSGKKKQFFSFSVLLTEVFRNIPHFSVVQCMSFIFIYELDMWPPKRSLPNLKVKMCLKHCKNQCFFEKCRFWGGGPPYIYIYMMYCIQICLFLRWNQNTVAAFSPSFMCCFCHLSWCPSMMQKSWRVHHVSVYVISVPCSEHALSATVSKCRRARLHSSARAQPSQWQKLRENGPQSNPNNWITRETLPISLLKTADFRSMT